MGKSVTFSLEKYNSAKIFKQDMSQFIKIGIFAFLNFTKPRKI